MTMLTLSGAEALRRELEALQEELHREETRQQAPGPTSETDDAAGTEAIEQRIIEVQRILAESRVVETPSTAGEAGTVKFGANVTLRIAASGEVVHYRVVGEDEADASAGRLSIAAPLAQALLGRKIGETVSCETPRGPRDYTIEAIRQE